MEYELQIGWKALKLLASTTQSKFDKKYFKVLKPMISKTNYYFMEVSIIYNAMSTQSIIYYSNQYFYYKAYIYKLYNHCSCAKYWVVSVIFEMNPFHSSFGWYHQ